MVDLRLESSDGEYLVLEGADGETYRLLIDEALRKAVRHQTVSANDANIISPRDIQLEVRSGVTIEELVQKTGASLEYIEKFAAPVVDELAHVVNSALTVRITMAGDRYNETTQVEFGEVVANRLASAGIVQSNWSARKSDNHGWQVHCRYGDTIATWAFDPRKLILTPENENAIGLSAQQSLTDGPIPRLRPVEGSAPSAPVSNSGFEPTFADPLPPVTQALTVVPAIDDEPAPSSAPATVTRIEPAAVATPVAPVAPASSSALDKPVAGENLTRDLGDTADFEGVIPFGRQSSNQTEVIETDGGADLANTADLLDALRKRRIERERDVLSTATGSISTVPEPGYFGSDAAPSVGDTIEEAAPEDEPYDSFNDFDAIEDLDIPAQTAPIDVVTDDIAFEAEKPKKSGRSSMPSWDEIVFNTRHDED